MNPYIVPATCDVCGEGGMLHAENWGMDWLYPVRHTDPEICAGNLARQSKRDRARLQQETIRLAICMYAYGGNT